MRISRVYVSRPLPYPAYETDSETEASLSDDEDDHLTCKYTFIIKRGLVGILAFENFNSPFPHLLIVISTSTTMTPVWAQTSTD